MSQRSLFGLALALVLGATGVACGEDEGTVHTITVTQSGFDPSSQVVSVGDKIVWLNQGRPTVRIFAYQPDALFDSGGADGQGVKMGGAWEWKVKIPSNLSGLTDIRYRDDYDPTADGILQLVR